MVQVPPSGFLPHAVPLHELGARQSAVEVAGVHEVLQLKLPSHRKGSQRAVLTVAQCPMPSQVRGGVLTALPAGHEPATHWVPMEKRWQAPAPSQVPSVPQPRTGVVGQRFIRSGCPSGIFEQVPSVAPGSAHDLQVPPQALPQQTPCSQKPEAHSGAVVQLTPMPLSTQALPLHVAGDTHSLGVAVGEQLVLHAPLGMLLSHTNRPGQGEVVEVRQVPAPSQVRGKVSIEPMQEPGTHWVPTV
jgi:hypothetical protein